MKIRIYTCLISQLIIFSAFSQDYDLIPTKHSDKWINGKEWSIEAQNGIILKSYFDNTKSGKLIFNIKIQNGTDHDFNIDPNDIYYITTAFDTVRLLENFNNAQQAAKGKSISQSKFFEENFQKYDTVRVEKSDQLIKNIKLLTGLGFLFDSDNLAISRGYSKIDYYKQNLLLKNTIEPNTIFERLLIIDQSEIVKSLTLVIPLGDVTFKISYQKE
jgi:hypothetical protein